MDSSSVELKGAQIDSISLEDGSLRVNFARVIIVKSMTGSKERTRWWQAGSLVMEGAELDAPPPEGPLTCAGGDIDDNVYTYRDMLPVPLDSHGLIRCELLLEGVEEPLLASARTLRLEMIGTPRYVEHLRPDEG